MICGTETETCYSFIRIKSDPVYVTISNCSNIRILSLDDLDIGNSMIELHCTNCPNLETINVSDKIAALYIDECPKIKKIPQLKNLKFLDCRRCPSLTTIPLIKGLIGATFVVCRSLISIPQNSKVHSYGIKSLRHLHVTQCHWSSVGKSWSKMSDQIEKLTILQRWFRKQILGRRLIRLIPWIMPLYYHPDAKGGYFEKKAMLEFFDSIPDNMHQHQVQ